MTCLGCGGVVCPVCEDRAKAIIEHSHWPLETSVSWAALGVIERAVRRLVLTSYAESSPELDAELQNLANLIRAHLQHNWPALPGRSVPIQTEEDWLS